MKRSIALFGMVSLMALAIGCQNRISGAPQAGQKDPINTVVPPPPVPTCFVPNTITLLGLSGPAREYTGPADFVIRSQADWEGFWATLSAHLNVTYWAVNPSPAPPAPVDFSQKMILARMTDSYECFGAKVTVCPASSISVDVGVYQTNCQPIWYAIGVVGYVMDLSNLPVHWSYSSIPPPPLTLPQ